MECMLSQAYENLIFEYERKFVLQGLVEFF
jgi:hypothetical protein